MRPAQGTASADANRLHQGGWTRARVSRLAAASLLIASAWVRADLPSDEFAPSRQLPLPASPHWVWVNNIAGVARLIDGDSGHYLGTLSTGYSFIRVVLPRDGKVIYSPEIYFSRGTRGTRTDVVTIYDAASLSVAGEIPIPAVRASNKPLMVNTVLTDDDRFLLIYNFSPAQSITVVDTASRSFAGQIETPGCAFAYPTGPRSFFSVCGDGELLAVRLDEQGAVASKERTAPMFDMTHDLVSERAVRSSDNTWLFVSFDGIVHPVQVTKDGITSGMSWSLVSPWERARGWRPGGMQQFALHGPSNRLYSIMHRGAVDTHKDPGKEVWIYDIGAKRRIGTVALKNQAGSIQVSQDAQPLLYSAIESTEVLDIYDAASGKLLRSLESVGPTPTLLVTP